MFAHDGFVSSSDSVSACDSHVSLGLEKWFIHFTIVWVVCRNSSQVGVQVLIKRSMLLFFCCLSKRGYRTFRNPLCLSVKIIEDKVMIPCWPCMFRNCVAPVYTFRFYVQSPWDIEHCVPRLLRLHNMDLVLFFPTRHVVSISTLILGVFKWHGDEPWST